MSIIVNFLRWLLVPVSAVAVLVLGAAVGRWFVTQADSRCDSANMIGGACVESWQTGLIENTIYVAVILAALAITLISAAIAPSFKRAVALLGALLVPGLLGLVYYRFGWTDFLPPLIVAIVAGAGGFFWVWSRSKKHVVS